MGRKTQTKIGIGAAALIAIMALLEPHLPFGLVIPIYAALAAVVIWGFWPLLREVASRLAQYAFRSRASFRLPVLEFMKFAAT